MLRYAPEGIGEQIVQIVGAISLITERDYDDPTMLANYSLQKIEEMKPDKIAAMARNVKAAVKDMPGREGMYLNGMIDAFEMFARILDGEKIPYKDIQGTYFRIEQPQPCHGPDIGRYHISC